MRNKTCIRKVPWLNEKTNKASFFRDHIFSAIYWQHTKSEGDYRSGQSVSLSVDISLTSSSFKLLLTFGFKIQTFFIAHDKQYWENVFFERMQQHWKRRKRNGRKIGRNPQASLSVHEDAMEKRKDKYFRDILSLYFKVSTTSELLNLLTMVKRVPHWSDCVFGEQKLSKS